MGEQARVSSTEALETFRAQLIVFLSRAHQSADEVGDEIRRLRSWVQQDQRHLWERELRTRQRLLGSAEQELLTAKLSNLRDNIQAQQNAVRKAKAAVEEAETKIRNIKRWTRDFAHAVDPLARRLESMRQYLDLDMPKALSFLVQAQQTLDAYAQGGAPPLAKNAAAENPQPTEEGSPAQP
jgi:DNA repair ATPase RecN